MKYQLPLPLTLLLGLLLLAPISTSAQTGPRVWAHKVSWTSPSNLTHASRRDFPIGVGLSVWPGQPAVTGSQPQQDAYYDTAVAQGAGIDAFAIDVSLGQPSSSWLPVLDTYLSAAATVQSASGKPFYVCPCLDSPANETPAQLALLIQTTLKNRTQLAQWPKWQGVPILWTYNGTGMTSANWKQTFALLAAQNVNVVIILDADGYYYNAGITKQAPAADLDTLSTLPVSLYAFRTNSSQPGQSLCQQVSRRPPPDFAGRTIVHRDDLAGLLEQDHRMVRGSGGHQAHPGQLRRRAGVAVADRDDLGRLHRDHLLPAQHRAGNRTPGSAALAAGTLAGRCALAHPVPLLRLAAERGPPGHADGRRSAGPDPRRGDARHGPGQPLRQERQLDPGRPDTDVHDARRQRPAVLLHPPRDDAGGALRLRQPGRPGCGFPGAELPV